MRPMPMDELELPLLPLREDWYAMMALARRFGWETGPYPLDSEEDAVGALGAPEQVEAPRAPSLAAP